MNKDRMLAISNNIYLLANQFFIFLGIAILFGTTIGIFFYLDKEIVKQPNEWVFLIQASTKFVLAITMLFLFAYIVTSSIKISYLLTPKDKIGKQNVVQFFTFLLLATLVMLLVSYYIALMVATFEAYTTLNCSQ